MNFQSEFGLSFIGKTNGSLSQPSLGGLRGGLTDCLAFMRILPDPFDRNSVSSFPKAMQRSALPMSLSLFIFHICTHSPKLPTFFVYFFSFHALSSLPYPHWHTLQRIPFCLLPLYVHFIHRMPMPQTSRPRSFLLRAALNFVFFLSLVFLSTRG